MILQPLIENAIVHGITPEKTVLNVTVEAELEGDLLRLWVIDDGSGIDPERLRDVMRAQDVAEGHTGLGLHAVDKRIRILLGEEYGVEVTSRNGQGTSVRLTLPIIRLSENQEDLV
ncbi:MAG: ATP-binding protein [Christensenellaceae bacterium]|nr:ATP-binding protein [Christensenellaceae bacterium]